MDYIIRTPTFADYDRVMALLIEMANFNELSELHTPSWNAKNERAIANLITECAKTGVFLVGEVDGEIEAVIIGALFPNIWLQDVVWLKEIAFWVSDKARHTKLGLDMVMEYRNRAQQMVEAGIIKNFVITSLEKLPVEYEKFGFHKIETNYAWSK
jgi:predicted GNAT superfamily acetyltransferase